MMNFLRRTTNLNGMQLLLILLISFAARTFCAVTEEDISAAMYEAGTNRYCGDKLNKAIKYFCKAHNKALILQQMSIHKKTLDNSGFDFESFDLDRVDDAGDFGRSRYNVDDSYYSNDLQFMWPSQAHRRRRGVIEECCKRACHPSDLIRYCPQ
ncbi:CLUMA_CG007218, isoform A [Clunio marinus]|uniref:CLUMA_CG007218, isoform A n=1 Tax=Clunio marinus TaxID=568069 RepID=A0A1J1I5N2_9DIPT|nr:CLUMA_CG007218, isoform A [Clunio marinus]